MSERLSVANAAATASAAEAVSPRRSSVFNTRSEPAAASHVDHCDNPAEPTVRGRRRVGYGLELLLGGCVLFFDLVFVCLCDEGGEQSPVRAFICSSQALEIDAQ